ncbi:pyridoxal phosphate-dependent transferase [Pavlovales sp. CCMP2436]|nr:pyridoxal phosphate-dependent transferase [Pavlovales sp. CCMP2436]|mmetsp:Transcript_29111/g.73056  ORF Transcript_29111/g.73056 Transcript_29111/m.73056 type:complete len:484 (-) Transcript_29111:198-1649(-)
MTERGVNAVSLGLGLWLLFRRLRVAAAAAPSAALAEARALDAADELAHLGEQFALPEGVRVYLCGHSLGLLPRPAKALVREELELWETLGERGHFTGPCWLAYHERVREPLARLVGASPLEVVAMNALTVNLHLLMASFYRPSEKRFKIVIEAGAFPSDRFAARSHAAHRGYDPAEAVVELRSRLGEDTLRTADILEFLETSGQEVALLMLAGVQYYTGQLFEIGPITAAARAQGCVVGWDLAHCVGNVRLRLHEWDVDFAAWCSYKYLNAGPGAIAGAFVHSRHCSQEVAASANAPPRLAGWWGNEPSARFRMEDGFVPQTGADGWQLSNPPILQLAALRGSLQLFDEAQIGRLVAKSTALTGLALRLLDGLARRLAASQPASPRQPAGALLQVITPRDPLQRGAQLSLRIAPGRAGGSEPGCDRAEALQRSLAHTYGVEVDYRRPHVLRIGLVPLYTRFEQVALLVDALEAGLAELLRSGS